MSLAIYQQNKGALKSDPSCLSLPEVSRYRSHILKRDGRPPDKVVENWDFSLTDAQSPAFEAEKRVGSRRKTVRTADVR